MKTLAILLAAGAVALTVGSGNGQAQTFTTLYSFDTKTNSSGENVDGTFPNCIIAGSDGNLYGTTAGGGTNGSGTAFKLTPEGTLTVLYTFCNTIVCPGAPEQPNGIVEANDGNFYGTTEFGGANGTTDSGGAVFKLTPQGTLSTVYSFCSDVVSGICIDGSVPKVPLIQGSDSNFYGTTTGGGSNDEGTVFQITPQGTLTTIYQIPNSLAVGQITQVPLYQGSDSNFYGISDIEGAGGHGLVFRVTSQGTFTAIYNFCTNGVGSCEDGNEPLASLIEVGGNLYGTARQGGANAGGIAFSMPLDGLPDNSLVPFFSFCSSCLTNGNDPTAPLVFGSDSNFYGSTSEGGTGSAGTVFQLTSEGTLTTLHDFCTVTNASNACVDGSMEPDHQGAALVQGCDGNFYGVTPQGGNQGDGIVYKIDMGLAPLSCTNTLAGGGSGCTYTLRPTNMTFSARGGLDVVEVLASNGCAWTAMSNDGFITILTGSNGTGNGIVHYSVAANTSTNEQVGTMTIADQTFTVTEEGTSTSTGGGCTYSIGTKTSVTLAAKGGKGSISVKTKGTDCSWTAVSNDPFITIVSGSSGTGSGKVAFTVPGNTNTTALSGTMTIAGETFTVNQDAGGCTFKLSPKDGKLKADGGSATIKVKPNFTDCDWTAVSNDPFITITAGSSGTGAGVVTYSVPANTNTTAVTGSITVGGQTFTVTQAGVK